jgi:transposase
MEANPRAIAHFGRASLQRSKTDRLGSETILEFAVRMPFDPWSPPAPRILELRALSRRIEAPELMSRLYHGRKRHSASRSAAAP